MGAPSGAPRGERYSACNNAGLDKGATLTQGEFVRVPVEHLDAFIGREIYIVHDRTAPDESGAWELLQEVHKEFVRKPGSIGEPDTMVLHEVKVAVDQSQWTSFSDSPWIAAFSPGQFARIGESTFE